MPNKRGKDQVLIAFALDRGMVGGLDQARCKDGQNRSSFIRRAIKDALIERGISVPAGSEEAPDRVKKKYPRHNPNPAGLNEGEKGDT